MMFLQKISNIDESKIFRIIYNNPESTKQLTETYINAESSALIMHLKKFNLSEKNVIENTDITNDQKKHHLQKDVKLLDDLILRYVPDHCKNLEIFGQKNKKDAPEYEFKSEETKKIITQLKVRQQRYYKQMVEVFAMKPDLSAAAKSKGFSVEFYSYITNNGARDETKKWPSDVFDLSGTSVEELTEAEITYLQSLAPQDYVNLGSIKKMSGRYDYFRKDDEPNKCPDIQLNEYPLVHLKKGGRLVAKDLVHDGGLIYDMILVSENILIDCPNLTEAGGIDIYPTEQNCRFQVGDKIISVAEFTKNNPEAVYLYSHGELKKIAPFFPQIETPKKFNQNNLLTLDINLPPEIEINIARFSDFNAFSSEDALIPESDFSIQTGNKKTQLILDNITGHPNTDTKKFIAQRMAGRENAGICYEIEFKIGKKILTKYYQKFDLEYEFPKEDTLDSSEKNKHTLLKALFEKYNPQPGGTRQRDDFDIDDLYWVNKHKKPFSINKDGGISMNNGPDNYTNKVFSSADIDAVFGQKITIAERKNLIEAINNDLSLLRMHRDVQKTFKKKPKQLALIKDNILPYFQNRKGYSISTDKHDDIVIAKLGRPVFRIGLSIEEDFCMFANIENNEFIADNWTSKKIKTYWKKDDPRYPTLARRFVIPDLLDLVDKNFATKKIDRPTVPEAEKQVSTDILTGIFKNFSLQNTRCRYDLDANDIDWDDDSRPMFVYRNGRMYAAKTNNQVLNHKDLKNILSKHKIDIRTESGKERIFTVLESLNQQHQAAKFLRNIYTKNSSGLINSKENPSETWKSEYEKIVPYLFGRSGYALGNVSVSMPKNHKGGSHCTIKKNNIEVLQLIVKNNQVLAFDINEKYNFVSEDDSAPGKKSKWVDISRLTDYFDHIDKILF